MTGNENYAHDAEFTVLSWNARSIAGFGAIKMPELKIYIKNMHLQSRPFVYIRRTTTTKVNHLNWMGTRSLSYKIGHRN